MKLAIGSDHGGYAMKEQLVAYLRQKGYEVEDCGTHSTESCDYPVYAACVGQKVQTGEAELGILVCGTGLGMSIAANKMAGIRAALGSDAYSAAMARRHNNANILTIGARVLGIEVAYTVVDAFLEASFEGGRHARRVEMLMELQNH